MADLHRLVITVNQDDLDLLLGVLALHVNHGWEEYSLPTGETECIVHSGHSGFCAELRESIRISLPQAAVQITTVPDVDWMEAWKDFFTPVAAGEHFLVLAPWMEEERESTNRIPLIIEPKMAFGTGHHPTTALCLEALSVLYSQGRLKSGMRFLDLGTGSGILGIAAAKLGMHGDGVDIDEPSIANALENRELNWITAQDFSLSCGSVEQVRGPYDFIMANILAAPLRRLAPDIAALLSGNSGLAEPPAAGMPSPQRGALVLSGILAIQTEDVIRTYTELGLAQPEVLLSGEWAALIFA